MILLLARIELTSPSSSPNPLLIAEDYTTPGLSPLFPYIACDKAHEVCIITTGEAEINAATTITALTLSSKFDLRSTYFLVAGIAGINPYHGTLGTAAFARFSVQVGFERCSALLGKLTLALLPAGRTRVRA
jgi:purine nucleoside permease